MLLPEMKRILATHDDFIADKSQTKLHHLMKILCAAIPQFNNEVYLLILPPFHCELNPIERLWAMLKYLQHKRYNPEISFAEFKNLLKEILLEIKYTSIPKIFRKARDHLRVYCNGMTGLEAIKAVNEVNLRAALILGQSHTRMSVKETKECLGAE
eukprot:TRINITY_DN1463_c1_g1_i4.p1 TRINITY_DN1463_c1_g1~~TRINITY_DN1463_c1_g1_i4.p1  ORF type:complete len:156 (+),score=39.20 TRINITY_DN1463_c1_g1_i4:1311-1778(+)